MDVTRAIASHWCSTLAAVCWSFIGGFASFSAKYPSLCVNDDRKIEIIDLTPLLSSQHRPPTELVRGRLYLGDKRDAHDAEFVRKFGITHMLNVSEEVPNYFPDICIYHRIGELRTNCVCVCVCVCGLYLFDLLIVRLFECWSAICNTLFPAIDDDASISLQPHLEHAFKFLREWLTFFLLGCKCCVFCCCWCWYCWLYCCCWWWWWNWEIVAATDPSSKNCCLIHCYMGRSRSVSIAIAFMMKYHGWMLQQGLEYLDSRRNVAVVSGLFIDFIGSDSELRLWL